MARTVRIGRLSVGPGQPLALVAGPDVIESESFCLRHAEAITKIARRFKVPLIFKCSFDKANRTSLKSYRGPGLKKGLATLKKVQRAIGVPVLSDVHEVEQVKPAAEVLDCLQVPAFLCRQTDLLLAVGKSGRPVNVKKGQFLAPWDMQAVVEKIESTGNQKILLTERGTFFGYNYLVNDMRSLAILRGLGYPVVFDAGHSTQLPSAIRETPEREGASGGLSTSAEFSTLAGFSTSGKQAASGRRVPSERPVASGGQAEFIPLLSRAAVAAGCDALFVEVHEDPAKALCDGPSSLPLRQLPALLEELVGIRRALALR